MLWLSVGKCGGSSWNSFTNHNTRNYLHHGYNITANQRLSPIFCGNQNTINDVVTKRTLFPKFVFFFTGGGGCTHSGYFHSQGNVSYRNKTAFSPRNQRHYLFLPLYRLFYKVKSKAQVPFIAYLHEVV